MKQLFNVYIYNWQKGVKKDKNYVQFMTGYFMNHG